MPRLVIAFAVGAAACAHPVPVLTPEAELATINARCEALTAATSRDSQVIVVGTIVTTLDAQHELPREYRQLVGQGIRQFFITPTPLPLETYDDNVEANGYALGAPSRYAALTLRGIYSVSLRKDGRLLNARALGTSANRVFDAALVNAIVALDTSGLLPSPRVDESWFSGDSTELRIVITARSVRRIPGAVYPEDLAWSEPLLRFRVPVHRIERPVRKLYGPDPTYPANLAQKSIPGKAVVQFVVGTDGMADATTMQVLPPVPPVEFVHAAFDAVRASRFTPMVIAGCPVRTLVEQPFVFLVRGR
jgi:hypothetical protein